MEEKEKNMIKFEMPGYLKFLNYKLSVIVGVWMSGICFIILFIQGVICKQNLIYNVTGSMLVPVFLSFLALILFRKVRNARFATELTIDKEKKEFFSYLYDIKKEVKFNVNDITEISSSPEMFRFCLKDGTWVSWAKDNTSKQILEETIKSFGISITSRKLW